MLWNDDRPERVPFESTPRPTDGHPVLTQAAEQLAQYFAGDRQEFTVPLDPSGTEFQQSVWTALAAIPYGTTCSYRELARRLGRPTATRAVGAANGRNPLSIFLPCHRVVGADGSLTGFAGGLDTKAWLLRHERGERTLL